MLAVGGLLVEVDVVRSDLAVVIDHISAARLSTEDADGLEGVRTVLSGAHSPVQFSPISSVPVVLE